MTKKKRVRTEAQKLARREYDKANKEKQANQKRAWNEANKEKVYVQQKNRTEKWISLNEEGFKSIQKKYRESAKDGYFTVYYLPEEHYVGQTNALRTRMKNHRGTNKRHILDVEVLAKFETREEALAFEAKLHSFGYNG
jgi:hypothetical protein